MSDDTAKRVVMTKAVARAWLLKHARPEYRFHVLNPNAKDYPSLLRAHRDGRLKMGGVQPLPDLGIKEDFGGFQVWSSDHSALMTLQRWFERKGLETSWIW